MDRHDRPPDHLERVSWASSEATRRSMVGNRGRDTLPELAVRRALHGRGYRYRVDHPLLIDARRRADIVFPRERLAIFIDGCFWHGCGAHYVAPRSNADYWSAKVTANRARDLDTDARLEQIGWESRRFWEHEAASFVVERIARVVEARRLVWR